MCRWNATGGKIETTVLPYDKLLVRDESNSTLVSWIYVLVSMCAVCYLHSTQFKYNENRSMGLGDVGV